MINALKSTSRERFSQIVFMSIITLVGLMSLFPFCLVLAGSFTSEDSILRNGFRLIPGEFSTQGYLYLFRNFHWIMNGYKISTIVTLFWGQL